MIIDARLQFEDEPKSFGNKRHRQTDAHRAWIEHRYRDGWADGYSDDHVKLFKNTRNEKDFAYHKVNAVFWQTDENDQPATVTEKYEKSFTAANIAKEQAFYCRQPVLLPPDKMDESIIRFDVRLTEPESGRTAEISLSLDADASFPKLFGKATRDAFAGEIDLLLKKLPKHVDEKKAVAKLLDSLQAEAAFTHRHYVRDDEYIPFGEDIEAFLRREVAKPIIHWQDSPQLGYEILPNKYFYNYVSPTPAKELLAAFWKLEKEAETMLAKLPQ